MAIIANKNTTQSPITTPIGNLTGLQMVKFIDAPRIRAAYTNEKVGTCEFSLSQLDDVVFGQVTGLTASVVNTGSTYTYAVGSEDLSQQAILMVVQNKLDGKEWQFYNPNAYLNFSIEDSGDEFKLKVTGLLPFFSAPGQASEQMLAQTLFR